MIALWMAYALLVSALAGAAAAGAERALRLHRRPARLVWLVALGASTIVPATSFLLARFFPGEGAEGGFAVILAGSGPIPGVAASREGGPWLAWPGSAGWPEEIDAALVALWAASSLFLGSCLIHAHLRLRGEAEDWKPWAIDGVPLLVSLDRGPAVVGFFRGGIVVPRWVLRLDEEVRRLVLLHEAEHLRAGDHRLRALGLSVLLSAPWNPLLWWQVRRLRVATEMDCDARVLERGIPPRRYGLALIEIGGGRSGLFAAAAFAERGDALERRIRAMTPATVSHRWIRSLAAGGVAVGLAVAACETPAPPVSPDEREATPASEARQEGVAGAEPSARGAAPSGAGAGETALRPSFIPYDTPPRLRNTQEVMAGLQAEYPADLKEAGVGGTTTLWLHVDAEGRVRRSLVQASSGEVALDAAARRVAERMRFDPAELEGSPTPVWVSQAITFRPTASASPEAGRSDAGGAVRSRRPDGVPPGEGIRVARASGDFLIIVDGRVLEGATLEAVRERLAGPEGLHPGDIERVEVVKGPGARELYGERAAAGVVVITTEASGG